METPIMGYWNLKKEKIKLKYANLTDQDLNYCEGKEKEMNEILAYKLGITKLELVKLLKPITGNNN